MGTDMACGRIANRQYGVLSRNQALASGMTEPMIWHRIGSGRWESVLPGVYRISGAPIFALQQLMAAHLYAGRDSVVCARSAAAAWGLEGGLFVPVEVASPRQVRTSTDSEVVPRRCSALNACDVALLDCLPITNRIRTLIDMSAEVSERTLDIALDQVLRSRPASLGKLVRRMDELRPMRLRGTARLRRLVEERDPRRAMTESQLETLVRRWIRRHGFPEPVVQHRVLLPQYGTARLDFAYPDKLVGVEADSYAWHSSRDAFERDRARNSEFASLGWIIIQTTSREMERYPDRPATRLWRALERRAFT